jgi:arylsulfatase A-like enzyme
VTGNTLLIFTSDNGCSPRAGFEELAEYGHNPNYIFRGHKADIFEGGHRIPFIASWPARIPAGSTSDEIICLTDLLATCAVIVDYSMPDNAGEDSYNILPAMLQQAYNGPVREATIHHSINGSFAIRQGPWKLVMCPGSGGWSSPRPDEDVISELPAIQLYNLEDDVGETTNLQHKYPEVVTRLRELLTSQIKNGRSTPGIKQANDGEQWWPQLTWIDK